MEDKMEIELEKLSAMTGQSVEELRDLITKAFEPFRATIEQAMKDSHRPVSIGCFEDKNMGTYGISRDMPLRNVLLKMRDPKDELIFDECVDFRPISELLPTVPAMPEPTPKPIQKNKFAFLDGLTPKRRAFNQKFQNFKGR